MRWNVDNVTMEVRRRVDSKVPDKITWRAVLFFLASVFDALEHSEPFTMRLRILLKAVWAKSKQQINELIDVKKKQQFVGWVRKLVELENMPLKGRSS